MENFAIIVAKSHHLLLQNCPFFKFTEVLTTLLIACESLKPVNFHNVRSNTIASEVIYLQFFRQLHLIIVIQFDKNLNMFLICLALLLPLYSKGWAKALLLVDPEIWQNENFLWAHVNLINICKLVIKVFYWFASNRNNVDCPATLWLITDESLIYWCDFEWRSCVFLLLKR